MYASLSCGALSAKCTAGANALGVFCFLGREPGLYRTPFAKTPSSWFLTLQKEKKENEAADVWKKDVWGFQPFSPTFFEVRFSGIF